MYTHGGGCSFVVFWCLWVLVVVVIFSSLQQTFKETSSPGTCKFLL